jgi:hypothetical protein
MHFVESPSLTPRPKFHTRPPKPRLVERLKRNWLFLLYGAVCGVLLVFVELGWPT